MAIYGVQKRLSVTPPDWIVTKADDISPGRQKPVLDIDALPTQAEAEAVAAKLNGMASSS